MGALTLHIGQCGNEIGNEFYKYLIEDLNGTASSTVYNEISTNQWFTSHDSNTGTWSPRSVLIDTETKVTGKLLACNSETRLKYKHVVVRSSGGSANNWAYGYYNNNNELGHLIDNVLNCVRTEFEQSDSLITSLLSIFGSGGGTGSGLGTRLLEQLRDLYPNKTLINTIVLPHRAGEIVTQDYNTILCLAKLYELTDASLLIENDQLFKMCEETTSSSSILEMMNSKLAQQLAGVLQPIDDRIDTSLQSVTNLTLNPNYRFVQIVNTANRTKHIDYESYPNWSHYIKTVLNKPNGKCVGNLLITRGGSAPSSIVLNDSYPIWVPHTQRCVHFHQPRPLKHFNKFLTLVQNSSEAICNRIENVIEKGWILFQHKAYLHQYKKYGVDESDFEFAFEKLESVALNYKDM